MKNFRSWLLSGALTLLSACSLHQTPVVISPVGPAPRQTFRESSEGYLTVYSAWDTASELNSVTHHSSYSLTSEDGKMTREIQNHIDGYDAGPERISLPPGAYQVAARATATGKVIVPIIIKAHETTFVYLDGSGPNRLVKNHSTNAVELPNGDFVGWAAGPNLK